MARHYGGDFTLSGLGIHLDWIEGLMTEWFEVKVRARLGPDEADDKEIDILGRKLKWTDSGIQYQADPKHRDMTLESFGLGPGSKGLKVTGKVEEPPEDEKELEPAEASEFRAVAARMNYMAQDCPDIQFATKEVCREMASGLRPSGWPGTSSSGRRPCSSSGGSTTSRGSRWSRTAIGPDAGGHCGVLMRGEHCLKTWSTTQGPIALSSAEAEYYAMVDGVVRAFGAQAMCGWSGPKARSSSAPTRVPPKALPAEEAWARPGMCRHVCCGSSKP